ncbi:MAG: radical SAM protein [Elusimicrobia bacterium]|nr:radical SAM protein [Elusimicrobiota bacterium]
MRRDALGRLRAAVAERFAPAYSLTELVDNQGRGGVEKEYDSRAIRSLWEGWLAAERSGGGAPRPLHFYVHVPFCLRKCAYCYYDSGPAKSPGEVEGYLKALGSALEYYGGAFGGRRFQTLYVGGGTPSLLSEGQLEGLLGLVRGRFEFDERGEKTVECNPASVTGGKLAVLERFGVNRISMGVQSLAAEVLAEEERGYQTREMVAAAVGEVLSRGRFALNLDLIAGLGGDTQEGFLGTFREAATMGPDGITVYPVWPTRRYVAARCGGDAAAFYAGLERRHGDTGERARALAAALGYEGPARPRLGDHSWIFKRAVGRVSFDATYDDVSERPMSLFGVGPSSRSRLMDRFYYRQERGWPQGFDPLQPAYRGLELGKKEEALKYVWMRLWKGEALSGAEYRGLFEEELDGRLGKTLSALERRGLVTRDGDDAAFAPMNGRERFECALAFVDRAWLEDAFVAECGLASARGSVTLRVKRTAPGEPALASVEGVALQAAGDARALAGGPEEDWLQSLLVCLFRGAAAGGGGEVSTAARRFESRLRKVFPGLRLPEDETRAWLATARALAASAEAELPAEDWIRMGDKALRAGEKKLAAKALRRALAPAAGRADGPDVRRWLEVARAGIGIGDAAVAKGALSKAESASLALSAQDAWVAVELARLSWEVKEGGRALAAARRAADGGDAALTAGQWLEVARVAAEAGDRRLAGRCLERARGAGPKAEDLRALAMRYQGLKEHGKALKILDDLVKAEVRASRSPLGRALADRGVLKWLMGDAEGAIADLREARRLEPGDLATVLSLGSALESAGRPAEALALYEEALAALPPGVAPADRGAVQRVREEKERLSKKKGRFPWVAEAARPRQKRRPRAGGSRARPRSRSDRGGTPAPETPGAGRP